jgi:uncharacterized membrane protein YuzA (DUF378 family)
MYCPIGWTAKLLCAVGAINWGLVAFLRFNVVEYLHALLPIPYLNMVLYGLVAASGVYVFVKMFVPQCKTCK